MRDVTTSPLFLRIGNRGRGPEGTPIGALRRVILSNLVASGVDPRYPILLAGLPGHPVEDVQMSNVRILYKGGGPQEDAAREVPENETAYPEPSMFGTLPVYGLYARHVRNLTVRDFEVGYAADDARPPVLLEDVKDAFFLRLQAQRSPGVPAFVVRGVDGLVVRDTPGLADTRRGALENAVLP